MVCTWWPYYDYLNVFQYSTLHQTTVPASRRVQQDVDYDPMIVDKNIFAYYLVQ